MEPASDGPVGAARPPGDAPPGRRARADALAAARPRRPVPPRPLQRPGRHDPARRPCRPARRTTSSPGSSARASSRRSCSPSAPTGDGHDAGQRRRALRLLAPPGRGPARRRVASLVDVDPRLTLEQYQLLYSSPGRPAGPLRRDRPCGATTKGDLTAVHGLHPVRPQRRGGPRARPRPARPGGPPRAARRRQRPRRRRRGGRRRRRVARVAADFPRTAAFIVVTTFLVLFVLLRSVVLPVKALVDEHALDRRLVRRAGVDLPGRQPVGAPRLPAAGLRRDDPAGDPVLRPVRAVDGLRGLPAVAHEGGLGPDRRQHRRRWRAGSSGAAGS